MKIAIITDMHIGVRGDSKIFLDHQEYNRRDHDCEFHFVVFCIDRDCYSFYELLRIDLM